MNRFLLLLGAVPLLLGPALAAPSPAPPAGRYCTPLAFRDQVIGMSYKAVVRAAPGCKKPALVRKESLSGSVIYDPFVVQVGEVVKVWLLTHRLTYSLDGQKWQRVVMH